MYYEEKVVDGILHYRTHPDVEFIPFSIEALTNKYLMAKEEIEYLRRQGSERDQV